MNEFFDAAVIGAGVIGGMLARELSKYRLSVCLLEKENDVSCGASKANSGIIHGGYDPIPGTCKARLNAEGAEKLFRTAELLHVPYRKNGSMVCAFSAQEDETVRMLLERGRKNGVRGLCVISGEEARGLEPKLSDAVTSALLVENSGIICPYQLTIAAVGNAMDNGVTLLTNFEVVKIETEDGFALHSSDGRTVRCRYLVNCAGGCSDKIAELAGDGFFKIIPRAGEYLLLDKTEGSTVSHTIFQVPTKEGKGVLVTPTADGNLLIGPTANAVSSPDSTETTAPGLEAVAKLAARSVPSLNLRSVITSFTGVRASERSGDFIIEPGRRVKNLLHVAAIDSPGLSCCVSVAEYAVRLLGQMGLSLEKNPDFCGEREDVHAFRHMSLAEKDAYIRAHPAYGRIVCRCETVSEGEIRDCLRRDPKPTDLDGVKRRTRAGMGRCQGGFCAPFVMKLISEETGISMENVTKKGSSSRMVTEKL